MSEQMAENIQDKSPPVTDPEALAVALSNVGTMSPRLRKLYDDVAAVLRTQAAGPVPAREVARQVFSVCEQIENLPDGAQDSQEVERFKAGQRFAAKRIRNAIGTWLTDEENTWRAAGASNALLDVAAERRRQIYVEGWTPEHDDEHKGGEMAFAAAAYAVHSSAPKKSGALWLWTSWAAKWFKPKNPRADLVRAAALMVAEIERLDRTAKHRGE